MFAFIHNALDILFPPSEEALIVRAMAPTQAQFLLDVRVKNREVTLAPFSDRRIQALIHEAKFHGNKKAFQILGTMFDTYIGTHPPKEDAIFIPVSLSKKRERDRGCNQVTEALKAAQEKIPTLYIDTHTLIRTRDTTPQTKLKREQRLDNMENAFALRNPENIAGRHLVLVDDVTTTGTTLSEAKRTLRKARPKSITTIALAG